MADRKQSDGETSTPDLVTLIARFREAAHQASLRAVTTQTEAAMVRLTEKKRLAIDSKFKSGLSYEAIAKLLGEPSADAARRAVLQTLNKVAKEIKP
jgi:hypothetical protein